ncbi:UNVERIFIED_CONTAM: hypothetical protein RMT77_002231 [Armadillidium vulgare]
MCGGVFYLIIHYAYFKNIFEQKEKEMAEIEKLEKLEKKKKMLRNGVDKCPSYNEISMDLHHSFLALAGPPRKYSVDGSLLGLRRSSSSMRETNKEASKNRDNFVDRMDSMSTSVPFLSNAEFDDSLGSQDPQQLSKSMNYVKK